LATFIGATAGSLTRLIRGIILDWKTAINLVFMLALTVFCGKIISWKYGTDWMNWTSMLPPKHRWRHRVQSLLDQAKKEAEQYETDIQAKDLKIQALILELAHLRRLRYGVKNEALSSV
jgi:hypothetical protein